MNDQSPCPSHMVEHVIERTFPVHQDTFDSLWDKLNSRETFVDGQIFPYRVEFDAPAQKRPFAVGERN